MTAAVLDRTSQRIAKRAWLATPDTFGRRLSHGTLVAPSHLRLLSWLLYLSSIGYVRRLTIAMPPGHAKSTATSRWFPGWDLELRPKHKIILASYESTLAVEHGKAVREMLMENADKLHVRLKADSQAADRWVTMAGGGLRTAGAGGSITGRRADIFIVDDPFKGFDDSHSPTQRGAVWNWYRSVARTRLLPGGSIIIVQTRWHPEDLIGMVSEQPNWVHLRLPAIAEEDESIETVVGAEFVAKCARDGVPLPAWHRAEGEPLWPWLIEPSDVLAGVPWYSADEMAEIRDEVGEYVWQTLYQQNPTVIDGDMFKRDNWVRVDAAPAGLQVVRRWDMAATEGGGDATAGVLMGRAKNGRVYILDVKHERYGPSGVERLIANTAEEDAEKYGRKMPILIEQEGGSAGKNVAEHYAATVLPGFNVRFEGSTGDKTVRALPLAAQVESGNVYLVRREGDRGPETPGWWSKLIDEAAAFPNGAHDDIVDAASLAYMDLLRLAKTRKKASTARATGSITAQPMRAGIR
ncbi:phage terminase large subunit [Desertimonas flava]|uniref:phage terminase large subunit n=1 Tax=Desertimonas flava TaxID=2064846 RepID=UPI000E357A2A|nr:phage terminase large subunit [Desertimonas flava]